MTITFADIKERLLQLARIRASRATTEATIAEIEEDWNKEHADILAAKEAKLKPLLDLKKSTAELEKAAESDIKQASLTYFSESKSRSLPDGVSITVGKKYTYDKAAAIAWAIKHDHMQYVALDERVFGEMIKSKTMRPDFVTEEDEPSTRFYRDKIDEYLKPAVPEAVGVV